MILNDVVFFVTLSLIFGFQAALAVALIVAALWYGAQGAYFVYCHLLRKLAYPFIACEAALCVRLLNIIMRNMSFDTCPTFEEVTPL
jgi:hypothetical protein